MTALDAAIAGPYDRLAPTYPCLTAGYDHRSWLLSLIALAREAGLHGRHALDVACGAGDSAAPLLNHGFDVTGVDRSPGMLDVARDRLSGRARLHRADMRELPRLGAFDLVTCLDDSLNHLLTPADLRAALAGMARNLAPGGVMVFDLNTLSTLRTVFSSEWKSPELAWTGLGDPQLAPGGVTSAEIALADGDRVTITERHHPLDEVLQALWLTGLEAVASRGQHRGARLSDEAPDEAAHHKLVIAARRPVGISTWARAHGLEGGVC